MLTAQLLNFGMAKDILNSYGNVDDSMTSLNENSDFKNHSQEGAKTIKVLMSELESDKSEMAYEILRGQHSKNILTFCYDTNFMQQHVSQIDKIEYKDRKELLSCVAYNVFLRKIEDILVS